ncbi:uncharacterized protein LOC141628505 [Silene latifolia]|uniref:uncharacterized protein LOC141628505 n=1 Tax=Silene latifolia TaxID=37657 RepID=UPI003D7868DC
MNHPKKWQQGEDEYEKNLNNEGAIEGESFTENGGVRCERCEPYELTQKHPCIAQYQTQPRLLSLSFLFATTTTPDFPLPHPVPSPPPPNVRGGAIRRRRVTSLHQHYKLISALREWMEVSEEAKQRATSLPILLCHGSSSKDYQATTLSDRLRCMQGLWMGIIDNSWIHHLPEGDDF